MIWLVGLGGIFGALSRFLLGKWITSKSDSPFPLGTWIINLSGCFVLGLLAYLHVQYAFPEWGWYLLGVGFLGAYTTFSTFGFETIQFMVKRDYRNAAAYVSSSVILGIVFAWIGSLLSSVII
jgi:fluoride exporter